LENQSQNDKKKMHFCINKDKTISLLDWKKRMQGSDKKQMVLGYNLKEEVTLVERGSKQQLVFKYASQSNLIARQWIQAGDKL